MIPRSPRNSRPSGSQPPWATDEAQGNMTRDEPDQASESYASPSNGHPGVPRRESLGGRKVADPFSSVTRPLTSSGSATSLTKRQPRRPSQPAEPASKAASRSSSGTSLHADSVHDLQQALMANTGDHSDWLGKTPSAAQPNIFSPGNARPRAQTLPADVQPVFEPSPGRANPNPNPNLRPRTQSVAHPQGAPVDPMMQRLAQLSSSGMPRHAVSSNFAPVPDPQMHRMHLQHAGSTRAPPPMLPRASRPSDRLRQMPGNHGFPMGMGPPPVAEAPVAPPPPQVPLSVANAELEYVLDIFQKHFNAPLEARDASGRTPLIIAAMDGRDMTVRTLIRIGASVDATDTQGNAPLHYAALEGHVAVAESLLGAKSSPDCANSAGTTPLMFAAMTGKEALVAFLCKSGAGLNTTDHEGRTPLTLAVLHNQQGVVRLLIAAGADTTIADRHGMTATDYAHELRLQVCVALLTVARSFPSQSAASPQMPTRHAPRDYESVPAFSRSASATSLHSSSSAVSEQSSRAGTPTDGSDLSLHLPADAPKLTPSPAPNDESSEEDWDKEVELEQLLHDAQDEVDPDWEDIDDEEIHLHPNAEIQPEVPALLKASASYGMVTITPNRSRPSDEPDEPEPDPITPRHVAHRTAGGVVVALDSDTDLPADKIKDKKPRTTKGTKLEIPLGNAAPASSGDEVDEEAAAAMQAEQQAAEDRRKELIEEKRLKMHKRFLEKKKRKAEEMRARKQKIAEERERRKQEKLERQREHEEALAQLAAQEEEAQKKKKKGKKKKKPNLTKHMSMRNLKSRRTLGGRLTGLAAAIEEDKRSRSSSTGRRKRTPLRRSASSSSVESDLHTQAGKDDEDDEEEADAVEEEEEASEESDSESDSEDDGAAENDSKPKPRKRRVKKKKQQGASIFDRLARGTASSQARRGEALRRRSGGKAKQAPISKEEQRRNRRATMGGRMQSSSKDPKTKTVKKRKNAGKRKKSRNDSEEFGPVKLTRASRSPVPAEAEEEAAEEAEAVEEEQPETVEEEEEQEEEAAQGRGRSRVRNGGSRTRSRSRPRVPIQETKRSNYKLVCSALRYRCLRGYAHDHVRGGVLDMLKPFRKGNFVIVVEGHANSFRGVMRLDLQTGQALHIYGHVPDVIEARNVKTFFKYASDTKYFIPIQVTTFSPTTDAVALRPVPLKEQTDHRTSIMEGDWEAELLRLEQERLLVEVIHTNAGGPNGRGKKKGARASASPSNANRALKKPRRVLKPSDLQLSEVMSQELAVYTCYLNMCLEDDPHLQGVLPLDVKTPELLVAMRDGWILAKFVNYAVPLTIDTRALTPSEGEPLRKRAMLENMTLVVDACRSIGVKMANVSARMLVRPKKNEKQCIGFLWRLIKSQLLDKINVRHSPALLRLLGEHEDAEEFAKQSPRVLLLRWLEYHTHAACSSEDVAAILAKTVGITDVHVDAFSHEHLRDMLCYALLMNQLAPDLCHNEWLTNVLLDIKRGALDSVGRALRQSLIGLGLSTALAFLDVTAMSANSRMSNRLHLSFSALIFQAFPGLVPLTSAEIAEEKAVLMDDDKGDSREERAFRMWMNSMNLARRDGKRRYLDNLFEDCRDGLALLEVIDKLAPGSVNWSTVKVEPRNKFERVGNCNQAIELAKSKLGCSLQGIQGSDLEGANRKLCLALVWQLMSHHLAQFLREVFERKFGHPPKGGSNDQKMILEWANQRAKQGPDGMDEPVDVRPLTSFKDPELRDALFFLHLLWAISPRVVDWDLVTKGSTPAERLLNARYAISVARKLGAAIFLLPEDITECRPRLVQTFVASILSLETLTCGATVEEDEEEDDDE